MEGPEGGTATDEWVVAEEADAPLGLEVLLASVFMHLWRYF